MALGIMRKPDPVALGAVEVGTQLGSYRLIERIGSGGMGEVYRAQNVRVSTMVRAVKVILPALAEKADFHARFLREAALLDSLRHENILRVDDIGDQDGVLYMVMELLAGRTLDQMNTEHGRLPIPDVLGLLAQALDGIAHAHGKQIIHRDLKPSNLFVTTDGVVKVLDFGIARHGDNSDKLTGTDQATPGSPHYYAPEFGRAVSASAASDVYAMGISLYELLTGKPPFEAGGATDQQRAVSLLFHHMHTDLPDPREIRAEIPEELVAIVRRATAKAPEDRFGDASTFAERLRAARAVATPPAPIPKLKTTRFSLPPLTASGEKPEKPKAAPQEASSEATEETPARRKKKARRTTLDLKCRCWTTKSTPTERTRRPRPERCTR